MSVEGCTQLVGCSEYHKLVASSTIKDSYAMQAWSSSYTVEVWKGFLRSGSTKGCTELVGCIVYHKRSYTMESRRVVLSRLAATRTIKASYAAEVQRSSYTVEVWKVVSSWLATSSTIKGSYTMEV